MTAVTINGNTYSDDGTEAKDMRNGGHRTHFFPLVQDNVTVAGQVAANAAQVATDKATVTSAMAGYSATSTTNMLMAVGALAFTFQANKQFQAGDDVVIFRTSDTTKRLYGRLSGYVAGTGATTVDVSVIEGAGTFADWTMRLSGIRGAQGVPAGMTRRSIAAADTILASDTGKFLDLSGTTYELAAQPCATLGAGSWFLTKNGASGTVTINPDGAELIDGAATLDIPAGNMAMIQCDGSALRTVFNTRAKLVRIPIFSSAAASLNPATVLETLQNTTGAIGLTGTFAASNNSIFITAQNGSLGNVASSPDGVTHTLRAMPSAQIWVPASDGSGFMAVAANAANTAYSAAGTAWAGATALPGASISTVNTLTAISGRYLVRGAATNTTLYMTINNGTAWTTETAPAANLDIGYGVGGLFFLRTASSNAYYTSATGATGSYTLRALPSTCESVTKDAGDALIAWNSTDTSVHFYRTTDGINWTDTGLSPITASRSLISINGVYLHSSGTVASTSHSGRWVSRTLAIGTPSNNSIKSTARVGNITMLLGASTTAYVFDPTTASATTGLFD